MCRNTSIVVFELHFGIARSQHQGVNSERLRRFLAGQIETLAFDDDDAVTAGKVSQAMTAAGTPIGPYDMLIAGQALRHGATLVTANTCEFSLVPGLLLGDWSR